MLILLLFFPSSMSNVTGILVGILLNQHIILSSINILTILIIQIYEHRGSCNLFYWYFVILMMEDFHFFKFIPCLPIQHGYFLQIHY